MEPSQATRSKPKCEREDAVAVLQRLREAGHVAYFAGGCVRDLLLGLQPEDYDVATDAPPSRVRELFTNTQAVGAAFGVILVRHGKSMVEVATFRAEGDYLDGRRPSEVHFTNAQEDARRRDFTINGLFLDPVENRVIDYVGGQEDLAARCLRAIGNPDDRFEEDHLRLLRAVRFAARFSFEIEPNTAAAITKHAQQLKRITPERIAEELRAMLMPPTRALAWEMLWRFKLMQVIFRHLPEQPGAYASGHGTYPVFPFLSQGQPVSFGLALAALTYCYRSSDRNEQAEAGPLLARKQVRRTVQACRTGLRISNDEANRMAGCLELQPLLEDEPPTVAASKRFLARPFASDARAFLDALRRSNRVSVRAQWLEEEFARLEQTDFAPAPLITGDDLTAAGLKPGPVFRRVLDAVYDAQLEGKITSREAAMDLAGRLAHRIE